MPPELVSSRLVRFLPALLLLLLASAEARAALPSAAEVAELQTRLQTARHTLDDSKLPLSTDERALLSARLSDAEQSFQRFQTLSQHSERKATTAQALTLTGGAVMADDFTGVGISDDFLLPLITVGFLLARFSQSADLLPSSEAWNLTLIKLYVFSTAVTQVLAARKPGCACKCFRRGIGPISGDRQPNEQACRQRCITEEGYSGYQCGGAVIWIN